MHILGIDCGGTSTQALLTAKNGHVLGKGQGGPANFTVNGVTGLMDSVLEAITEATKTARFDLNSLKEQGLVLALGVSGAGRESERVSIKRALFALGFAKVVVDHDASIALLGALSGQDGVIVIAGTGSIAYGLHREKSSRAGGWGYLLGDEGGAFWLALKALQQVMEGYDGRSSVDQDLTTAACQYFGLADVQELIPLIYKTPLNRGVIGGFSKEVASLAKQGHVFSRDLLGEAGRALGRLAVAALKQLGALDIEGRVGACGGVFAAGQDLVTPMQKEIWLEAPRQKITHPDFDPVVGAVLLGAKAENLNVHSVVIELQKSL